MNYRDYMTPAHRARAERLDRAEKHLNAANAAVERGLAARRRGDEKAAFDYADEIGRHLAEFHRWANDA